VVDRVDSQPDALVFNRAVSLKDSWARQQKQKQNQKRKQGKGKKGQRKGQQKGNR